MIPPTPCGCGCPYRIVRRTGTGAVGGLLQYVVRAGADEGPDPVRQVRGRRAARQLGPERSRRADRPEQPGRPFRHPGKVHRSGWDLRRAAEDGGTALLCRGQRDVLLHTVQNKVWATDPDGNKWEVYVVLDNNAARHHSTQSGCCADKPGCCEDKAACCTPPAGSERADTTDNRSSACACSV
jgi:hypothetical protein